MEIKTFPPFWTFLRYSALDSVSHLCESNDGTKVLRSPCSQATVRGGTGHDLRFLPRTDPGCRYLCHNRWCLTFGVGVGPTSSCLCSVRLWALLLRRLSSIRSSDTRVSLKESRLGTLVPQSTCPH